ncbi:MAG: EthD family reductase [Desulfobacterales bacterium]|nr:EthD family reductase [Desulfobacterales bacterium]
MMYKVSVMYPNNEGAEFDYEYYRTTHMDLVKKYFGPFGLTRTDVDKGIHGGGEKPAPYICIGNLYFDSRDGYDRGIAEFGSTLRGDIPNFTNLNPIRQISEILE